MNKKKENRRILIVSPTDSFCGAGQFRHTLAVALQQHGYEVAVAQPEEDTPLQKQERLAGVKHFFFPINPYKNLDDFFRDRHMAAETLGSFQPELILFSSGLSPYCYIPFLEVANFLDTPYAFIEHQVGKYMFRMPKDVTEFITSCYTKAGSDSVITVSDQNLKELRRGFSLPPNFGRTIVLGRNKNFFSAPAQDKRVALRKSWNIPNDALVVITVAKLEVVKGHGFMVHAMNQLKSSPHWNRMYFVWVGDGSQTKLLQQAISEIGVTDHVRFLGHCWDVASLYDGADIFALTSFSEGLPLTLMESMAKGLPGLCTDAGGTAEGLGDGGLVLGSPSNPTEVVNNFVTCMNFFAEDKSALSTLSSRAKARAELLFKEERMIEEYLQLVEKKLKAKSLAN